jgi:hypothetical protein
LFRMQKRAVAGHAHPPRCYAAGTARILDRDVT